MLHAVIMAGGSGTRFWPASRNHKPKQMLDLAGSESMIQSTVSRLGDLVDSDRVLIVTNDRLVASMREQFPHLPPRAILGEPCKRDTAPCVGLAAACVRHEDPEAIMAVMPADHVIHSHREFQDLLRQAMVLVEQEPDCLVTFGIKPTYPAESFGYVERGESIPMHGPKVSHPARQYRVQRFREKPKADVARQFLDAGTFYWNSGIFVWRAQTILDLLARFEPEMYSRIDTIARSMGTPEFLSVLQREFAAIQGKSIDFAVMERAEKVAVVEAVFDWDDVGSWKSLERLHSQDEHGNTLVGLCRTIDSARCILRSEGKHLIATVGMEDVIVVHTPDATLVVRKDDEESVRKIVKLLETEGLTEYL